MGIACVDRQIFKRVRVKIMDLGLSSVRVRVKVRANVTFMVSFRHFKVHNSQIRTSAQPWPLPCSFHLPECPPTVCIRWGPDRLWKVAILRGMACSDMPDDTVMDF